MIVAFDPGKMTGVAWWSEEDGFASDQFAEHDLYRWVDARCEDITHGQIEKFTITQRTIQSAREYDPLYIIGYLRYCAWRCDFPIAFSNPADVMKTFPDASLKKAGMFHVGRPHGNDAARHLARLLVMTKRIDARVFFNG